MRYKSLTKEQLLISIDRLTRFKQTKEKYLRVYYDILVECLIEPKYKRKELENLDYATLTAMVSEIINNSFNTTLTNNIINKKIAEYENYIYNNDDETQILLNNNINYERIVELIPENSVYNLKWLKSLLTNSGFSIENRRKNLLKYPLTKVLLVEGITEEILLPAFSAITNKDFYAEGVQIIAAGGKNQVVKKYYELSEELKLPIFVLLDRDGEDNINQIVPKLRAIDKVHLVSCGEFEDMLPKDLIIRTLNKHFENFSEVSSSDFNSEESTVKILEEIFKEKGTHEFKKAEFAKLVRSQVLSEDDISEEIMTIIREIFA